MKPHLREALARALPRVSAVVVDQIGQVAARKLHTTSAAYMAGLQHPESVQATKSGVRIQLIGDLPQALEEGYSAFDLKPHLLRSGSAKTAADGSKYVDVSFRHGVKDTTRLKAMPAGVRQRVQADVRAKQREGTLSDRERVTGRSGPTQRERVLRFGGIKLPVVTKTKGGFYDDMLRTARKVGKRTMVEYRTFRRISSKSDPMSWWHPGFDGVHAFREVRARVRSAVLSIVRAELHAVRK